MLNHLRLASRKAGIALVAAYAAMTLAIPVATAVADPSDTATTMNPSDDYKPVGVGDGRRVR